MIFKQGRKHTEETKQKIRESRLGKKNPMFGRSGDKSPRWGKKSWNAGKKNIYSDITIKKMSMAKRKEKNPMWKGDDVGLYALHLWIRENKNKSELCEICGKEKSYDLANISGEYKRDVNDFRWLCRKCHMISDNRLKKLIERTGKKNSSTHVTHAVASSEAFTSPSGVVFCEHYASEDGEKEDYSLLKDHRFFSCNAPSPTHSHRLDAYLEAVWAGDEAVRKYHARRGR